MTETVLNLENLSYSYPGGVNAIDGVTFSLLSGEKHGIIGPNGAGKSTLLQLITGLIESETGKIHVQDLVLNRKNRAGIRKNLGLLFQNSDDQLFSMTVKDDVAFGPRNLGMSPGEVEDVTIRAMESAGISHLADRAPYTLSGGEKKSAALASILSMDPGILLLDEPTAGLDPRSRRGLIRTLGSLNHSMLIISHDLDFIRDCCSRVSILHQGRIVSTGDTESILTDKDLLEQYGMELPFQLQRCQTCPSLPSATLSTSPLPSAASASLSASPLRDLLLEGENGSSSDGDKLLHELVK